MSKAQDIMTMDSEEGHLQQKREANSTNGQILVAEVTVPAMESSLTTHMAEPAIISNSILRILHHLPGENANREGLRKTPDRYTKALLELTNGYGQDANQIVNGAFFDIETDPVDGNQVSQSFRDTMGTCGDIIVQRDIQIFSLCEHHMLPFFGKV